MSVMLQRKKKISFFFSLDNFQIKAMPHKVFANEFSALVNLLCRFVKIARISIVGSRKNIVYIYKRQQRHDKCLPVKSSQRYTCKH